jgi:hypothetical protein
MIQYYYKRYGEDRVNMMLEALDDAMENEVY